MEAIRGTWSIGGIALGPIRICPRMGRTDTAGPTLSPEEELNRFEAARRGAMDQLEDLYGRALDQAGMEAAAIFRIHQRRRCTPPFAGERELAKRFRGRERGSPPSFPLWRTSICRPGPTT